MPEGKRHWSHENKQEPTSLQTILPEHRGKAVWRVGARQRHMDLDNLFFVPTPIPAHVLSWQWALQSVPRLGVLTFDLLCCFDGFEVKMKIPTLFIRKAQPSHLPSPNPPETNDQKSRSPSAATW